MLRARDWQPPLRPVGVPAWQGGGGVANSLAHPSTTQPDISQKADKPRLADRPLRAPRASLIIQWGIPVEYSLQSGVVSGVSANRRIQRAT